MLLSHKAKDTVGVQWSLIHKWQDGSFLSFKESIWVWTLRCIKKETSEEEEDEGEEGLRVCGEKHLKHACTHTYNFIRSKQAHIWYESVMNQFHKFKEQMGQ